MYAFCNFGFPYVDKMYLFEKPLSGRGKRPKINKENKTKERGRQSGQRVVGGF